MESQHLRDRAGETLNKMSHFVESLASLVELFYPALT